MADTDFTVLLEREVAPQEARIAERVAIALDTLAEQARAHGALLSDDPRRTLEAIIAALDAGIAGQVNLILHHPEFQQAEATWRGVQYLILTADPGPQLKIRVLDISKRELIRSLRKYRGTAWDQSPIFKKVYEEEYGQFGGHPYGVLIGDYYMDHSPQDTQLLADMAMVAAAAHAPFITGTSPTVMQMESWAELANPRDLTRIFRTPEYAQWRSLRASEDARYLGLCLPRVLARLPYGTATEPLDAFDFEEDVDGPDARKFLWMNAAYAMAANIARAFNLYGWCVRIRGIETGGAVEGLPAHRFPTADGDTDLRCSTEVALSERREAELAMNGFIPLVHRKNADFPAVIGAQSVQQPQEYDDPAATTNASLAARLPYLLPTCRFAHYLKCMVRDKIGTSMDRAQLQHWLQSWLRLYIDGSPETSSEEWKAAHPLEEAKVTVDANDGEPGKYEAKFYLRPHYQLEGVTAAIRLVSRLASP